MILPVDFFLPDGICFCFRFGPDNPLEDYCMRAFFFAFWALLLLPQLKVTDF